MDLITLALAKKYADKDKRRGKNLFNKSDVVLGYYMSGRNLTGIPIEGPSSTGLNYYSNLITVDAETTYHRNKRTSVFFYNCNNELLGAWFGKHTGEDHNEVGSFITPIGTSYIRVCGVPDEMDELQIEEGEVETEYERYGYTLEGLILPTTKYSIESNGITFEDVLNMVDTENPLFNISEDIAGRRVLKLESLDTSATKITTYLSLTEGNCVQVNLNAKADNIDADGASVRIQWWRKGVRGVYAHETYNVTSTDIYKDHKFIFPVPPGVDQIEVILYARNNVMYVRNFEISQISNPMPINHAGVRFTAHLGMIKYAPRNTMPAFELAKRCGFWGCVMNVGRTSDGHIVCLHDLTIDATSDGTGYIRDMTLEQVRQYDFGSWFKPWFKGTKIPLLDDVLKLCARSGMHPVIRISDENDEAFTNSMYNMVKKNGLLYKATFKGFGKGMLNTVKAVAGNTVRYGYCVNSFDQDTIDFMKTFQNAEGTGAYIDCSSNGITEENMQLALASNMPVEAWTVNNFMTAYNLMEMGVSGFTTDNLCLDGCMY